MKEFISKRLEATIKKEIKINDTLIKALQEDAKQYNEDNSVKITSLKEKNASLNSLIK